MSLLQSAIGKERYGGIRFGGTNCKIMQPVECGEIFQG